jgi:hypothetical protein
VTGNADDFNVGQNTCALRTCLLPEFGIKSVTLPQVNPVLHKYTLQQKTVSKANMEVNTHIEDSNHFQTVL